MKEKAVILAAELSGIQNLAESSNPEEMNSFMKEMHSLLETTVRMHHGQVVHFTGKDLLAVFQEDKTTKAVGLLAVDTAYELKERIQADYKDHASFIKMGIATGDIFSTEIQGERKMHQSVIGEAVNHADKICQFAEEGQILMDQATAKTVSKNYTYQKLEAIPLQGNMESLPIFELLLKIKKKLDLKLSGDREIASEMVGRSNEMEQLEGLIKQLIKGKGSVVNIIGKAGIGKSRLVAEMKIQPLMEKVIVLEGRALSTGENLSFHPIIHLIKSWANISEEDPPLQSSLKLQKAILNIAPDLADDIYSFVGVMMGLPLQGKYMDRIRGIEGEALEKLILKNLRDLIISASKDKPRIYLIEDMHWADTSSITLFESLYKLSQHYPVMFINVLRPGYKETGDYMLKYLVDHFPGTHTTIHINPLEELDSDHLIHNLLRQAQFPKEIHRMIIHKTQGNPFFIEEIIRSFIDRAIIEVDKEGFVITDKIHEEDIPETINEVILSRVNKLDEKTRELLNTASVMGRNFYYKVLEEVTDTIGELDDRLAYLSEIQLISESKKKEEIEYLFKHALAQQLTYDTILQQSRKDIHLKIACSIEKVFFNNINEYYGTLAYHYKKAEKKEKTEEYLILAGDEAMKTGASSSALNHYLEALELLDQKRKEDSGDKEIRTLYIKIAMTNHTLGETAIAIDYYEMIMERYFKFKFAKSEKLLLLSGVYHLFLFWLIINNQSLFFKRHVNSEGSLLMKLFNDWGYAYIHLNPKHFALKGMKTLVFISLHNLKQTSHGLAFFIDEAILFNFTGLSLKTAQKMIDFARNAGGESHPQSFINYRMIQCVQNYFSGNWAQESDFAESYEKGLRVGKYWTSITYIYYTGMCAVESGDYLAFKKKIEILDELTESLDISYAKILKYRLKAMAYLKFRKLPELRENSDEGIKYLKTTGDEANLFMIYCMKAQGGLYFSKIKEAEEALLSAEKIIEKNKNVPIFYSQYLVSSLEYHFKLLMALNRGGKDFKDRLRMTNKIWNKLNKQSKKNIASRPLALSLKARILCFLGDYSKAKKYFKLSIQLGEKYQALPDLSRTCFEAGKLLSDPNVKYKELDGHSAKYYLDKARTMFEEMNLQWDLKDYEKWMNNHS